MLIYMDKKIEILDEETITGEDMINIINGTYIPNKSEKNSETEKETEVVDIVVED